MKLSQRTANLLFAPTVALCMSGMMSFVLTIINQGVDADFVSKWLKSFGISFVVAVPIAAFVVPRMQKFFESITEKPAVAGAEN